MKLALALVLAGAAGAGAWQLPPVPARRCGVVRYMSEPSPTPIETRPLPDSDAEWKEVLSPEQFRILREEGTEPAFSSTLNSIGADDDGVFLCAGCKLPLFRSQQKFESGSGWPSFWAPVGDAVTERTDL